jgi:type II secretory pathway pseudopilin PulG
MRALRSEKKGKAPRLVPVIRRRSEDGDTLIEVLMALIVLGLASVSLLVAFGTVISASAEHRSIANQNLALQTAAQSVIAAVQNTPTIFQCIVPYSQYPNYTNGWTELEGGKSFSVNYSPTVPVQFWSNTTNTFSTSNTCTDGTPQLITLQLIGAGLVSQSLSFVVAESFAGSGSTGTATQIQIINTPAGSESGTPAAYQLTSTPGTSLSFQPVVEVEDAAGNPVSTDLSPVILQISVVSGSGTLSGCTGLESGGYVTFSGCTISASGTYQIYATDNSLSSTPSSQNGNCTGDWPVSPPNCQNSNALPVALSGQGYSLVFVQQPVGGASGAALQTQPWIEVENASGAQCTTCTGTIALTSSGGTLTTPSGVCSTIAFTGGLAKATGCAFAGGYKLVANGNSQATYYVLIATATGYVSGESGAFGVTSYGAATQIAWYTQPIGVASSTASTAFATQTVTIPFTTSPNSQAVVALEDSFGNIVVSGKNSYPATVGITLTINGAGETLNNCANSFSNGYFFITGCSGTAYLNGVTLTATGTAANGVKPAAVVSTAFNITRPATKLVFTTQPVAGASGTTLLTMPVIAVEDVNNNIVTAAGSASMTLTATGGLLQLCTNLTPVAGIVSVQNCTFAGSQTTTYYLNGSITVNGSTATGTSTGFSPTLAGSAAQLVFTTQPVGGVAGAALSTQPVIQVEDSYGNLVNTSNAVISLNASGGTLANCTNLAAANGIINVTGCTFGGLVSTNYQLFAISAPLNQAASSFFQLSGPGPASQLILNINKTGSSCTGGIQFQGTCTATATNEDAYGNVETTDNSAITFTITGPGAVTTSGFTQSGGVASETLTGSTIGSVSIFASDTTDGLTSSTGTFTVVGKNQVITWTAPSSLTWGTSAETLGGAGPTSLGGTSASFPGTGGSSIVTSNTLNNPSSFSASLWFNTTVPGSLAGATGNQSSVTSSSWDRNIFVDQAGHLVWAINFNGALDEVTSSAVVDNGTWHQVVATYGPTGQYLYLDGTLVGSAPAATAGQNYAFYWHLGFGYLQFWPDNQSVSDYFQGSMAQAAIFTSQLTLAQVQALYGATSASNESAAILALSPSGYWPLSDTAGSAVIADQSTHANTGYVEGTYPLGAATDSAGTTVTFASSTPSVCTVSGSLVTTIAIGTCTITPTAPAGGSYALTAGTPSNIAIGATNQTFTLTSPSTENWVVGGAGTFTVVVTDSAGTTVSLTSTTTSVCTISGTTVRMLTTGICTLSQSDPAGGNYLLTPGNPINISILGAVQTITWTPPGTQTWVSGGAGTFSLGAASDSATTTVTFASSTTSVCTVSGTTVTMLTPGICTITPTAPAGGNYVTTVGNPVNITINGASQTITWTAPGTQTWVSGGAGTFSLGAASDSAGTTVTFASSTPSVCTVSGTTVTMLTPGTCTITPTAPAGGNYAQTTGTASNITINKASQTITVTTPNPTRVYFGSIGYTPAATSTSGLTVAITLDGTSTGCTLSGGNITWTSSTGTCKVDFNQAGNASYNAATQVQLVIPIVNMGINQVATGTGTTSVTSGSFSEPSGTPILILISYKASGSQTCVNPTGAALNTGYTEVTGATFSYATGDFMCAYSTTATGTASTVAEAFSGATTAATIQIIDITGDNNAVFTTNAAYTSGNSNGPTFNEAGAAGIWSTEVLFASAAFTTTQPVWDNGSNGPPNLYTETGSSAITNSLATAIYTLLNIPAGGQHNQAGGFTSGAAYPWGTLMIEVTP